MRWKGRFADNTNPSSVASRLRRRRFDLLLELVAELDGRVSLLDVGGTPHYWEMLPAESIARFDITLMNLRPLRAVAPRFLCVEGDARDLSGFADGCFDVAFSNSVIEHVGTFDDQRRMAEEVRRVGRHYYVQTPNYWFPIEPHFQFPGFQFLPSTVRARFVQHFDLGWCKRQPDLVAARREVEAIRLLTRRELRALFPDGILFTERYLGLAKSFVVHSGSASSDERSAPVKTGEP